MSKATLFVVNSDDPGELIKASAEGAASGAIGTLIEPISGFLGKLFGGSAEQLGGWAADIVAFRRWKSRVRIAQKAEQFLIDAGLEAQEVPRPVLMPMLEAMGDEEDESMVDRWASLLASAASRDNSVPRSFPRVLAELEPDEARILDHVYESLSQIAPQYHPRLAVLKRAISSLLGLTENQVTLGVENLMRLRLVRAAGLTIGDASDADGIRLTDFGWTFIRACRPPSEADPPIRFNDPSVLKLAERNREMWTSPASPEAGVDDAAHSVATAPESNH